MELRLCVFSSLINILFQISSQIINIDIIT